MQKKLLVAGAIAILALIVASRLADRAGGPPRVEPRVSDASGEESPGLAAASGAAQRSQIPLPAPEVVQVEAPAEGPTPETATEPPITEVDRLHDVANAETEDYSSLSLPDLEGLRAMLSAQYAATTSPAFDEFYASNRYTVEGHYQDGVGFPMPKDPACRVYFDPPTGEVRKVVLPEEDYPEVYSLWRRMQAAGTAIALKKAQEH